MFNSDEAITIRYDLDEYIEDIINGLSDEEYQEIIKSIPNGCLSGILIPKQLKKYMHHHIRKMMLNKLEA